ncbi:hypothetical protein JKG47_07145 [Acidithiobacillus sp. MC6.1]|nr:hypothetical protein [Acidithiobacillus sp. MC6.1]
MHPADLFIAKTIAGREKDHGFLDAMIEYDLVKLETVLHLLPKISGKTEGELRDLRNAITGRFSRVLGRKGEPVAAPQEAPASAGPIPPGRRKGP